MEQDWNIHKQKDVKETGADKTIVTHNLDTGEDEPLKQNETGETLYDFGLGGDGGSADMGGAA